MKRNTRSMVGSVQVHNRRESAALDMKAYSHLSAEERIRIDELRNRDGLGVRQIALRIGRDKATVSRELKRGLWFASNENCLCSISCCGFSHDDFSGLGRACRPRNGLNWMVLVSPPERTGKDYDQHAPSTVYPSFAAERGIRRVDRAENTCRRSRRCVSTSRRRICRPCRR